MPKFVRTVLFISAILICYQAQAQAPAKSEAGATPETTMKVEDAAETKNKVSGDIDKEITNPKLRADSGSKSKFSGSIGLNYRGGSISRPFGVERPDLLGVPESQVDTSLGVDLRARYRTSKNQSYYLGTSIGAKTPFHGDVNAHENQLNVSDPVIGSNTTFAKWGLQNTWNVYASLATSQESRNIDQIASVGTDYTFMKVLPNRIHVGIQGLAYYNFYDSDPGENAKTRTTRVPNKHDTRAEFLVAFNPTFEYHFSDRVSFRTLFSWFRWRNLYGDDEKFRMLRMKEYQSVGFGIVAARNVYLYPNVQFLPRDIRGDYTNFAMSASMNLF